jgi:hypothetical protein
VRNSRSTCIAAAIIRGVDLRLPNPNALQGGKKSGQHAGQDALDIVIASRPSSRVRAPLSITTLPVWPLVRHARTLAGSDFVHRTRLRKAIEERSQLLVRGLDLAEAGHLFGQPLSPLLMSFDLRHPLPMSQLFLMQCFPCGVDARLLK